METNLDVLIDTFSEAINKRNPVLVFGKLTDPVVELKKQRTNFLYQCHPDHSPENLKSKAEKAFVLFSEIYELAELQIKQGKYGTKDTFEITIDKSRFDVEYDYIDGELCTLHKISGTDNLLKISKDPSINFLIENERACIGSTEFREIKSLPTYLSSCNINNRNSNCIKELKNFISLEELRTKYKKDGVDGRTLVWIFNRIFEPLMHLQSRGIVHSAITPDNFMINAENHGGVIIDFCYAKINGSKICFISNKYRNFYPKDIFKSKIASYKLDVYLVGQTLKYIAGDIPKELSNFLDYLTIENTSRRPSNSIVVYGEMKDLSKKLYGQPAFHPLVFTSC